jgi:hypothetical protein
MIDPLGAKVAFFGTLLSLLLALGAVAIEQRALAAADLKTLESLR